MKTTIIRLLLSLFYLSLLLINLRPSVSAALPPGVWQFDSSSCGTYFIPYNPLFNSSAIQPACNAPGVVFLRGELKEHIDFSFHGHKVIYDMPGTYITRIESPAPWNARGAAIEVVLEGFLSFQGNPGDIFEVTATLVGVFDGITATAQIHEIMDHGGLTRQFFDSDFDEVLAGHPQGPHVSTLTVTMSGPGEFHSENSGISQVTPVTESSDCASLLALGTLVTIFAKRVVSKGGEISSGSA